MAIRKSCTVARHGAASAATRSDLYGPGTSRLQPTTRQNNMLYVVVVFLFFFYVYFRRQRVGYLHTFKTWTRVQSRRPLRARASERTVYIGTWERHGVCNDRNTTRRVGTWCEPAARRCVMTYNNIVIIIIIPRLEKWLTRDAKVERPAELFSAHRSYACVLQRNIT